MRTLHSFSLAARQKGIKALQLYGLATTHKILQLLQDRKKKNVYAVKHTFVIV